MFYNFQEEQQLTKQITIWQIKIDHKALKETFLELIQVLAWKMCIYHYKS